MAEYRDFSKADRKQFNPLIQLAVKRDVKKFITEHHEKYTDLVENDHEDIRVPYWELADKFQEFSKYLKKAYDGNSPKYLPIDIVNFLNQGILKESDLDNFSPEGKQKLLDLKKRSENLKF